MAQQTSAGATGDPSNHPIVYSQLRDLTGVTLT